MLYYAIRRNPDGAFLPAGKGKGFTADEPTTEKPPRLFTTEGGAKAALRWWKKGIYRVLYSRGIFEGGDIPDEVTIPVPGREQADMQIVKVRLQIET